MQNDQPPTQWIVRMRLYDSALSQQSSNKLQSTVSSIGTTLQQHHQQQQRLNVTKFRQIKNYYRGEDTKNPYDYKGHKFNMEQSWNPVNNYIYGANENSVYNQQDADAPQTHRKLERILNINSINNRERDKNKNAADGADTNEKDFFGKIKNRPEKFFSNRKLLGEFINNEAPKLCDHNIDEYRSESTKNRFCTPLESYVSSGRDMVSVSHQCDGRNKNEMLKV